MSELGSDNVKVLFFSATELSLGKDKFATFFLSDRYGHIIRINYSCNLNFMKEFYRIKLLGKKVVLCVTSDMSDISSVVNRLRKECPCYTVKIIEGNVESVLLVGSSPGCGTFIIDSFLAFNDYEDICNSLCDIFETFIIRGEKLGKFIARYNKNNIHRDYKKSMLDSIGYIAMTKNESSVVDQYYCDFLSKKVYQMIDLIFRMNIFIQFHLEKILLIDKDIVNGYLKNLLRHRCFSLSEEERLLFLGSDELLRDKRNPESPDVLFSYINFNKIFIRIDEFFGCVDTNNLILTDCFEVDLIDIKKRNNFRLFPAQLSKLKLICIFSEIFEKMSLYNLLDETFDNYYILGASIVLESSIKRLRFFEADEITGTTANNDDGSTNGNPDCLSINHNSGIDTRNYPNTDPNHNHPEPPDDYYSSDDISDYPIHEDGDNSASDNSASDNSASDNDSSVEY